VDLRIDPVPSPAAWMVGVAPATSAASPSPPWDVLGRQAGSGGPTLAMVKMCKRLVCYPQESAMTVTQIDLDDDALAEAMRLSGARSKKETVNLALREYAARHRRIAALEDYAAAARNWDYEGWQELRTASKAPAA
jgi:Arc/MetJ family transcription regulator